MTESCIPYLLAAAFVAALWFALSVIDPDAGARELNRNQNPTELNTRPQ